MMSKAGRTLAESWDLLLVMGLAVLAMGMILADVPFHPLRLLLGLLLTLWLPGYALTGALLPTLKPEFPVMLALYFGLSLCVGTIGAIVISLFLSHINEFSWTILLGTVTIGLSVIALIRQQQLQREPMQLRLNWDRETLFFTGITVVLVVGALGLSYFSKTQQSGNKFTMLWMLPETSTNSRNETFVEKVQLGVQNFEAEPTTYHLELVFQGNVVAEWQDISLKRYETWEMQWSIPRGISNGPLEAYLYLNNELYRQTSIWLQ